MKADKRLHERLPSPTTLEILPAEGVQDSQQNAEVYESIVRMILLQVHLRKPCYDFSFL